MSAYHRWHGRPELRLLRQQLLEIRGFLNYVVRTYPWLNPYTKDLHLTIDGWRDDRDWDGWRLHCKKAAVSFRRAHDGDLERGLRTPAPPEPVSDDPKWVLPMPRLWRDARALVELTNTDEPPRQRYRASANMVAFYMPGDASGLGFGSALIGA